MIFPKRSDYHQNLSILEHRKDTENSLYFNLLESSASIYFKTNPLFLHFFKERFLIAGDFLKGRGKFEKVLDAGTGIGFFLPYLSSIAEEVVGVDRLDSVVYARHMVERLGLKNVSVDQYDLISLPYPESCFDLIIAFSILDRFSPIELKIVTGSLKRILKPGGLLIIGYSTENAFMRFFHRALSYPLARRRRTRQILEPQSSSKDILYPYIHKKGEIEDLILSYGFLKEFSKNIGILNFIKLYQVTVFKNHGKSA